MRTIGTRRPTNPKKHKPQALKNAISRNDKERQTRLTEATTNHLEASWKHAPNLSPLSPKRVLQCSHYIR